GIGAEILNGASIGERSIIGANALVTETKQFPPRSLIIGSPARVVRELTTAEQGEIAANAVLYVRSDAARRLRRKALGGGAGGASPKPGSMPLTRPGLGCGRGESKGLVPIVKAAELAQPC